MDDILAILVEEPSMADFLQGFLPTILSEKFTLSKNYRIHPHRGKADLRKSIPKKVKGYRGKGYKNCRVHLMILHDQDSSDCKKLKRELKKLIDDAKCKNQFLIYKITIVCRELESWYFGDLDAVEKVIPEFQAQKHENKSVFRSGDAIDVSGNKKLKALVDENGKINLAQRFGTRLNKDTNKSQSFQNFIKSIAELVN